MRTKYRVRLVSVAGFLLGSLLIAGCGNQTVASGPPAANLPEVGVVVVQPEKVTLTMELPGRTSAYMIAEVRPQVGGIIQKRLFKEGSDVKAGQILYQIDPATYQAAYNSAKAALAKSEANVIPARLRTDRYKELVGINAVSRQDYDDASAVLKQAEADVAAKKADVDTARINVAYTHVGAPISGRIGRSAVTTGALVTASQASPLATIQQLDPIYVDVTQSSADMLRLKRDLASGSITRDAEGQAKVGLVLEDGTSYPLPGKLKFSEVTVDQSTGSVTLRTVFPNPNDLLLPGMYVRAVIEEGSKEQALLVPQRGVTRDPAGNATALVVGEGDKVELRNLKVARALGDRWLISDGLKPGDRLIVEGLQKAQPGVVVKAVPFSSKTGGVTPASVDKPRVGKD
ncbi:MAG: efflux RND transporter periplasmic adaptor subunit [Deltaproteobacteria bacterium]|nr:efflux RND transporter periplasmic adaptor subunit [Deltaproteobacteria bacterium]